MRCGRNHAIFQHVRGLQPENSNRFASNILVSAGIHYGGIRLIGHRAWQDISGATAGVRDARQRNFHRFECAIVVKIQARELPRPQFGIDAHPRVHFFAACAIGVKADVRFEQLDLCGSLCGATGRLLVVVLTGVLIGTVLIGSGRRFAGRVCWLLRR